MRFDMLSSSVPEAKPWGRGDLGGAVANSRLRRGRQLSCGLPGGLIRPFSQAFCFVLCLFFLEIVFAMGTCLAKLDESEAERVRIRALSLLFQGCERGAPSVLGFLFFPFFKRLEIQ